MEPINIKMKLADPTEVEQLIKTALAETAVPDMQVDGFATLCVRSIHSALSKAGCVIIQVDNVEHDEHCERDVAHGWHACDCRGRRDAGVSDKP